MSFCVFCSTTILGCDCAGEATIEIDGVFVVVDGAVVVVDGAFVVVDGALVVVVDDPEFDSEEMVLSIDDIVNSAWAPTDTNVKYPAAVHFPGDAHDTEVNSAKGGFVWMPLGNSAGRASSHTPFVEVRVNGVPPPLSI